MFIGELSAVLNWTPEPGAEGEQGRWGNTDTEAPVSTRNLAELSLFLRNNRGEDQNSAGTVLITSLPSASFPLAMIPTLWGGRRRCRLAWAAGSSTTFHWKRKRTSRSMESYFGIWVWKKQGLGRNQFQMRSTRGIFLTKNITSGSPKCSNDLKAKINGLYIYWALTYNMSFKIYINIFGLVLGASGLWRRYFRVSTVK